MHKDSFARRLLDRELRDCAVKSESYRTLYTDRQLINRLDIVNELDGHTGCVNALSWSKSGRLLASGSDDQHLNIHTYHPDNATSQFELSATVATGHTQNIFSVKFMPHSNDRTLITAAGDSQVRIFDLEYAGQANPGQSSTATQSHRAGRINLHNGVRYLSEADTNARVYKSHDDRVKRIVTESSPFLFLTCSEDGEVRQWDLRQPSSRYSSSSSSPPALISYKRYGLDLNTISCAPSQPHYILLGGAHLHAFLHDRRFTGRDRFAEMGRPLSGEGSVTGNQDLLAQATQCVKKFAPLGQQRMRRFDSGHITACKISDARPDEAVISWSGDNIYLFSLIADGTRPENQTQKSPGRNHKANASASRKRKRKTNESDASLATGRLASSRTRTETGARQDSALRINYENGQSEDISLPLQAQVLTERQRNAHRIATVFRQIQLSLFGLSSQSADCTSRYTSLLGLAASVLPDIDEIVRDWTYPMEPDAGDVLLQTSLRRGREWTRRYIQSAGTLARVLGGSLRTASGTSPLLSLFDTVDLRRSDLEVSGTQVFLSDFLKAILIWLDSGIGRLIECFTLPSGMNAGAKGARRYPIPSSEQHEQAIDEYLVPYLLDIASDDRFVLDLDVNRFERLDNRKLFRTQKEAVSAFAAALRIPFQDLSSATLGGEAGFQAQDRTTARRYWAGRVGRSLLFSTNMGLDACAVDRCFGGLGRLSPEHLEESVMEFLGDDEVVEEQTLEHSAVMARDVEAHVGELSSGASRRSSSHESAPNDRNRNPNMASGLTAEDADDFDIHANHNAMHVDEPDGEGNDDDDRDDGSDDDDDDSLTDEHADSSSEDDEEDGVPNLGISRLIHRSSYARRRHRHKAEAHLACVSPIRKYTGHCNVRTVKDVNFFGPNDDYVVSGSDDGNLFIWDRKTSELVNILEGDGEVVNVIQSHPYETMLAVSGIDHTIKIFSPDTRARECARLGRGVLAHDPSSFSSIGRRAGRRVLRRRDAQPAGRHDRCGAEDDEDFVAPDGLESRQRMHDANRITEQNAEDGAQVETRVSLPSSQLLQLLFGQLGDIVFMPRLD